jgi:hypothetical protein
MAVVQSITETYNAEFTTDLFVKPAIVNQGVEKYFTIRDGIVNKQAIYTTNPLGEITRKYTVCSDQSETGDGITLSEKIITTGTLAVRMEQCNDIWRDTIFQYKMKKGVEDNDFLDDAQLNSLMQELIVQASGRNAFDLLWFGNTAGGDNRRNGIDGAWTQIIQNVPGYCIDKIDTIGNNLPDANNTILFFRNLYNNCDAELFQLPENEKQFVVTRSIYQALLAAYSDRTIDSDYIQMNLVNGIPTLYFYGIEVIAESRWDAAISTWSLGNPHRILYMPKPSSAASNMILGTDRTSDQTNLQAWYSIDDDKQNFRMRYKLGFLFLHCGMMAVSY